MKESMKEHYSNEQTKELMPPLSTITYITSQQTPLQKENTQNTAQHNAATTQCSQTHPAQHSTTRHNTTRQHPRDALDTFMPVSGAASQRLCLHSHRCTKHIFSRAIAVHAQCAICGLFPPGSVVFSTAVPQGIKYKTLLVHSSVHFVGAVAIDTP